MFVLRALRNELLGDAKRGASRLAHDSTCRFGTLVPLLANRVMVAGIIARLRPNIEDVDERKMRLAILFSGLTFFVSSYIGLIFSSLHHFAFDHGRKYMAYHSPQTHLINIIASNGRNETTSPSRKTVP